MGIEFGSLTFIVGLALGYFLLPTLIAMVMSLFTSKAA